MYTGFSVPDLDPCKLLRRWCIQGASRAGISKAFLADRQAGPPCDLPRTLQQAQPWLVSGSGSAAASPNPRQVTTRLTLSLTMALHPQGGAGGRARACGGAWGLPHPGSCHHLFNQKFRFLS